MRGIVAALALACGACSLIVDVEGCPKSGVLCEAPVSVSPDGPPGPQPLDSTLDSSPPSDAGRPDAAPRDAAPADTGAGCDDSGCACEGNERRECYEGPAGTAGIGPCRVGIRRCIEGRFGGCNGQRTPAIEVCNQADDDCDGRADEGLPDGCGCTGSAEECNGADDDCDGLVDEGVRNTCAMCGPLPAEVCDGIDQDCDGTADEGARNPCGQCGPVPDEVCNGADDDCDGATDEGAGNACGECGEVPAETCDGRDEDCDGATDEDLRRECALAEGGRCGGVQTCRDGDWGPCEPAEEPRPEICNDVDDDCDRDIDEGLRRECGTDTGECSRGQQVCRRGEFGACLGEVGPAEEVCNMLDDDCDGRADEAVANACGGCGPLPPERCNREDDDCDGRVDEDTDLQNDFSHCGDCDRECPPERSDVCAEGFCHCGPNGACAPNQRCEQGLCIDLGGLP